MKQITLQKPRIFHFDVTAQTFNILFARHLMETLINILNLNPKVPRKFAHFIILRGNARALKKRAYRAYPYRYARLCAVCLKVNLKDYPRWEK